MNNFLYQYQTKSIPRVYDSPIDCGVVNLRTSQRVYTLYSEHFQQEVEVFTATQDPKQQILYRPSLISKKHGWSTNRIGMFLKRKKTDCDGIFQASTYLNKQIGTHGLKSGGYFISLEICKMIEEEFENFESAKFDDSESENLHHNIPLESLEHASTSVSRTPEQHRIGTDMVELNRNVASDLIRPNSYELTQTSSLSAMSSTTMTTMAIPHVTSSSALLVSPSPFPYLQTPEPPPVTAFPAGLQSQSSPSFLIVQSNPIVSAPTQPSGFVYFVPDTAFSYPPQPILTQSQAVLAPSQTPMVYSLSSVMANPTPAILVQPPASVPSSSSTAMANQWGSAGFTLADTYGALPVGIQTSSSYDPRSSMLIRQPQQPQHHAQFPQPVEYGYVVPCTQCLSDPSSSFHQPHR